MVRLKIKQKKVIFIVIFFLTFVYLLNFNIAITYATGVDKLFKDNLNKTATKTGHKELTTINKPFAETIGNFIKYGLSFIGVIFLALMIYGGYTWMLARGNEAGVEKAKGIIQAAIIGLVIVLAAYIITSLITTLWSQTAQQ